VSQRENASKPSHASVWLPSHAKSKAKSFRLFWYLIATQCSAWLEGQIKLTGNNDPAFSPPQFGFLLYQTVG